MSLQPCTFRRFLLCSKQLKEIIQIKHNIGLRVRQADHSATLPPCLLNACELSRFEPGTFSLTLSQLSYLGNHVQILKNTLSTILIVKENTEIHKQFTFTVNLWYKILYDFFESYCTVERE